MEHKPIYLDGVDVSGCEYVCNTAFGNIGCKLPFNEEIHCCNNPNCHYKQLKRKEQECEELKKQLMQKSEVDIFFNTPIEGWSNDPCGICKFKNCLTEIKEIAEPFCNACQEFEPEKKGSNCMYCNYGKILQIISECEVKND